MMSIRSCNWLYMCDSSSFWILPPHQLKDVLGYFFSTAQAGVTAWLAWVTYKVSVQAKDATRAQRDIAANQYKVSLYEIRLKAVQNIEIWINENTEEKIDVNDDFNKIIIYLNGINNLFDNKYDIYPIKCLVGEIESLARDRISISNLYTKVFDLNSEKQAQIMEIYSRMLENFIRLRCLVIKILDEVRYELRVPSAP